MIKYSLTCDQAHAFESWFPSSAAYDAQASRGLVTCPVCDSAKVEKRIMAPAVARIDKGGSLSPPAATAAPAAPEPAAAPVALLSERERAIRTMLRELREHVVRNADNVGEGFADEARRMHHGEIEHRSIYGRAAPEEARALIEEGIEIHPLPVAPDERN